MKPINLQKLLNIIELPPSALAVLNTPSSFDKVKHDIMLFKERVKDQRRVLAKKHHPDIGGDIDKMKEINDACDLLLKLRIEPIRPPTVIRMYSSAATGYNSTTTASGGW